MGVLSFLFVCCKLLVFLSESSFASDTITSSQSLSDGRTLVSKEGSFELGFFSPGSSKNRYVGICQNKSVVWSANLSKEVRIPVVLQLLDSGNLVLRGERDGGSETYLWQSFDYPSDTLLPGMKLGWDLKTGLERRITSWKSPDDPSPGNFTWAVERQDNPELMMWKGSRKFQRSGPWNGLKFSATSLRPNPIFNFSFVSNEDELYFTIDLIDKAVFSRIVMNQTLYLRQRFTWDKATQSWELDLCDTYALCGAYGICIISGMPVCQCLKGFKQKSRGYVDWSQGCVRDKSLNYSRQDGFIKFTAMKLPDATRSWVSKSMNLNECWEKCLDDSSCMAYTNSYIRGEGSGCAMWFGELIDMRDFPDAGQDLYIRMSASEIEYADQGAKSKPTTKIVVIVVPTAALLAAVLIAGYLIHKRRRNIVVNIIQYFRENRNMDLELPLFELATIANATDNFSINNKLGEGGFGLVYKPRELPIWSSVYWDGPEVPFSVWGDFYLSVGLYEHIHCISGLTSRLASYNVLSVPVYSRKLIAYESDEETEDSSLNLSIPTDFLHPSSSVGPSHGRDTLEYPRLLATSPSSELELVGNRGGPASGSGENHSSGGVGVPEEVGDVPGKCDVPSRPPRGYVTMHLESFKLGARLSLQRYFAKILGGMHLAPGQLHPNGWRVLSAMYVLWERCGSEEPSLVEVKHLYQRRSSPKEAGWYYFMSSSAKRKPITGFPSSCKNWKNKLFFAGGKWCTAARSLGGDIYLPTHFVTPESWGLVKDLEDRPLLQVKTALVNASTCQDLLSPTNLVCSGLVDIAAGMDNKILSAMTRKRGRAPSSSSNPPPLPKKANVGQPKVSVPTLPLPPPRKNGGEKVSDKSPEISIQSGDRSSPLPSRDQGDYLSPYQKDYGKSVGPKMVKDIESMNLSELAGSLQRVSFKLATLVSCYKNRSIRHERRLQADNQDLKKKAESADRSKEKLLDLHKQIMDLEEKLAMAESTSVKLENELGDLKSDLQATQSERDTLKTTLEGEIKSLNEQLAEAKGKSADVDDRLDAEYNSGVGFCYKCIMFVLKEEYPELNMSKLEDGVQKYMAEVDQGNKEQGDQDQVKAPLGGVQAAEAGDRAPEVGQGSLPPPLDVADPLLPEIADPSTVEAANPHNL
ncbi:Receptor-like serine/threonine-protein kinase SD1-8 [Citrus sinensis]|uniref:Receptor-like serine/threonine-protein kinase SD1-8 n=1 Tax=Citrus sinensis TaxID=2711 RepID=A0ACB8NYC0_CITSI|nr:Receptor-like serine/threonine-protein kinase SD1-8 [Citrus sinensis]